MAYEHADDPYSAPPRIDDAERLAGIELRRLRTARGWSQEEVARRMQAFGYEFHQTMIAKIEAAQRPLRVRELVDFAALYGVGLAQLVYALPDRGADPQEVHVQIARLAEQRRAVSERKKEALTDAAKAEFDLQSAQSRIAAAETAAAVLDRDMSVLHGRLAGMREASGDPGEDSPAGSRT